MPAFKKNRSAAIESLEALVLMSASSIDGTDQSDWISGTDGDDQISAEAGDDWIHAPLGSNVIDGGEGTDTLVVYEADSGHFAIELQRDGSVQVSGYGLNGRYNVNELRNVEKIQFNDVLIDTADLVHVNKAPLAFADTFATEKNQPLSGNVLTNDADSEGDAITASLVQQPANGSVTLSADGTFVYTPWPGFAGEDQFEYAVTDEFGATTRSTVSIHVSDPTTVAAAGPTAGDDRYQVSGGHGLFGNVSVNDFDPDAPDYELIYRLVDDVKKGDVNFYSDGSFDYVASPDRSGTDSFRYSVTDATGETAFATATIELPTLPETSPVAPPEIPVAPETPPETTPAPEPSPEAPVVVPPVTPPEAPSRPAIQNAPVAESDVLATTADRAFAGNLLANDSDQDGDRLQVSEVMEARYGTVTVSEDGDFQYQAANGFSGIDYFQYVVSDGDQTDRATVVIHVNADGELPTGLSDLVETEMVVSPIVFDLNRDGVISVTGETTARDKTNISAVGKTVSFDIDADGSQESIEWIDGTGDAFLVNATAINGLNIDGSALFGDEGGRYENGYVKLAQLDASGNGLLEGGELSRLMLWVDNGDGQLQAGELQSLQQHDVFSISTKMTLTPEGLMQSRAFLTNDWMIMTEDVWFAEAGQADDQDQPADDESAKNTSPDADPDVLSGQKGEVIRGNVLSNDRDVDGDVLRVLRHSRPVHGELTMSDDGRFTYTPDADFSGTDYFQYQVSDGQGGQDLAVVMLNVVDDDSGAGGTGGGGGPEGHTISGTVWQDWSSAFSLQNSNGLRDAGESVRGTSVFVSLLNGNGNVVDSVHTDNAGFYEFDGLDDGEYQIQIAQSSLPGREALLPVLTIHDVNSNFFDQVDNDINRQTGLSRTIKLGSNGEQSETTTVDIGYTYTFDVQSFFSFGG